MGILDASRRTLALAGGFLIALTLVPAVALARTNALHGTLKYQRAAAVELRVKLNKRGEPARVSNVTVTNATYTCADGGTGTTDIAISRSVKVRRLKDDIGKLHWFFELQGKNGPGRLDVTQIEGQLNSRGTRVSNGTVFYQFKREGEYCDLLRDFTAIKSPAKQTTRMARRRHRAPRYSLIYAGSGSYGVDLTSPAGRHGHVSAQFHWRVVYRPVARRAYYNWAKGRASGGGSWSMTSEEDECARSGDLQTLGDGGGIGDVRGRMVEVLVFPGEGDYSSTDPVSLGGPCDTDDFWRQWVINFSQVGAEDAVDPLTSHFEISRARFRRQRKITVKTSSDSTTFPSLTPAADCGFGGGGSCTQHFSWHATVTIKRAKR